MLLIRAIYFLCFVLGAEKEITRLKGLIEVCMQMFYTWNFEIWNLYHAASSLNFFLIFFQSETKDEVEHADILELNTIIGTLKTEKEEMEKEMVGVWWSDEASSPSTLSKPLNFTRVLRIKEKMFV